MTGKPPSMAPAPGPRPGGRECRRCDECPPASARRPVRGTARAETRLIDALRCRAWFDLRQQPAHVGAARLLEHAQPELRQDGVKVIENVPLNALVLHPRGSGGKTIDLQRQSCRSRLQLTHHLSQSLVHARVILQVCGDIGAESDPVPLGLARLRRGLRAGPPAGTLPGRPHAHWPPPGPRI